MTEQEIYKIVMEVENKEKVRQLGEEIARTEEKLRQMIATQGAASVGAKHFAEEIGNLQIQLKQAQAVAGVASHKVMALGQTIDDLQYVGEQGLRPVINNIMQLSPALGVVLIVVDQLIKHWGDLMGVFGVGLPQPALTGPELLAATLKKATEAMEELQKKTRLAWHEVETLAKLKEEVKQLTKNLEAEKNVKGAIDDQGDAEKAAGAGFRKAVAETGGQRAFDEFKGNLEDTKDAKGMVYNEATGRMSTVDEAARDMFDAALKGDKVSRDAIKKGLANRSAFGANIDKFSPEQAEAERKAAEQDARTAADDDADIASEEAQRKRKKDRAKERAAKDKEVDDAVAEVQQNQENMDFKDRHAALKDQEDRAKKIGELGKEGAGLQDQLMKEYMKEPDRRKSSVIGAADLANSIQGSVGGADKMVEQQKKTNELLQKIAENRAQVAQIAFGANNQLGLN